MLAVTLATGGAGSPLVPALIASLVLVVRYTPPPVAVAAPLLAAALLVAFGGDVVGRSTLIALLTIAASLPGWVWRRESRRSTAQLIQLDDILARAGTTRRPTPDDDVADVERALAALAARLGARRIVLWDVDGYHGFARARAASRDRPRTTLRLSGDPLGWVWEQGMRLRLEAAPAWEDRGVRLVADRLRRQGEYGLLITYAFDPVALPDDDLGFEEAAVYIRGVLALHEERAEAALHRTQVGSLLDGLRRMPGEMDVRAFASHLCRTAMDVTGATGAALGLWQGGEGELVAVEGDDGGPRPGERFAPPESELGLAIRAGTLLVRSAPEWTLGRTSLAHGDERWTTRPRALAAVPLRGSSGIVGVLAVWTSRARTLEGTGVELLEALSPYAALHLGQADAFGRMRESARRDPLTQLRNRRAFDEVFAAETGRFERYGRPLSLLVLDLDHFKSVNDQHGHEAGDEALRSVAQSIVGCIRDVDTAARFGGEEFVLLLPETPLAPAIEVAERIRVAVAERPVQWDGVTIPLRVSIGVSACPERVAHPSELLSSADAALYEAKQAGRDRVLAAGPRVPAR